MTFIIMFCKLSHNLVCILFLEKKFDRWEWLIALQYYEFLWYLRNCEKFNKFNDLNHFPFHWRFVFFIFEVVVIVFLFHSLQESVVIISWFNFSSLICFKVLCWKQHYQYVIRAKRLVLFSFICPVFNCWWVELFFPPVLILLCWLYVFLLFKLSISFVLLILWTWGIVKTTFVFIFTIGDCCISSNHQVHGDGSIPMCKMVEFISFEVLCTNRVHNLVSIFNLGVDEDVNSQRHSALQVCDSVRVVVLCDLCVVRCSV